MKEEPQTANKPIPTNILGHIGISTNKLVLIKSLSPLDYTTLLEGDDTIIYVIEGEIDFLYKIIDICYLSRDNNVPVFIKIDDTIIFFK